MSAAQPYAKAPQQAGRLRHFIAALCLLALLPAGLRALDGSSPTAQVLSPTVQALSATAQALSPSAHTKPVAGSSPLSSLSQGLDQDKPIDIQGQVVSYQQQDETLLAEGDVTLESGSARIHAERLWYDMKAGTLRAEGDVVVEGDGNTLWAEKVAMNQLSKTGQADDLIFYQHPWTAVCGGATLLPGDVVLLKGCECTSCQQEHPHWRLKAKVLKFKAGDRMTAYGVWLHVGRVPVFYLPYYSQSLKDGRPPIEIQPGYTQTLGAYVRTSYNYFLDEGDYGTVRYDWMDKKGNGFGAGQHYKLLGGEGSLAGYYTVDKNDPNLQEWSGNFQHKQDFGHGLSLLSNVDVLSDYSFNNTYDLSQVDVFQKRSFLTLQDSQADHSWSLQASETQTLQSIPDGLGGIQVPPHYLVTDQQLPTFTYTRFSKPLQEGSLLYWSLDAHVGRILQVPQIFVTATASSIYDEQDAYYLDQATINPGLSYTQRLTRTLSLNSSVNLAQSWQKPEPQLGYGELVSSYGASFNLQKRWTPFFTTNLGESHQRQLTQMDTLPWAGLLSNMATARANWQASEALSLLLSTNYNLLPYRVDDDLKRLGLISSQLTYSPDADRNLSLAGGWNVPTSRLKTVDASANLNDRKKRWQLNLGVNWVNNSIVPVPPNVDPSAPLELGIEDPRATPDQLEASSRLSLVLSPKWHVSYYERVDLVDRRLDEEAFSLWRDFSCIDTEIYARETLTGGWQYGFAISLSALPNVRVSSNQVTSDLFQPIQFGY